jgi:hypothetical protein
VTREVTLVGYAVLAAALGCCQLLGLLTRRVPTLGQVVAVVTGHRWGRWVLLAAWLWLGWHVFVRSHRA